MIDILTLLAFVLLIILIIGMNIVFYKHFNKSEKKNSQYGKVSMREASRYDVDIARVIWQIREDVGSCKITINRFHNGGNFANGQPMRKFTCTHETPGGSTIPFQDKCNGVLNSRYPEAFMNLGTMGEYAVHSVDDCTDRNFKHDMVFHGFKAAYLFLIENPNGSEEGFIGVNFKNTHVMTLEHRQKVKEKIPTVLLLLNMKKIELIEKEKI
jgi:hypothetical protein